MSTTDSASASAGEPGEYQLHDNVAVDLVNYVRSNTIRNEQQFLLLCYAYASGLFDDTKDYVSSVAIGTSSSGKSHLKDKVDEIFGHLNIMDASTGSDKSLIYDEEWDDADVISMGELQQPSEEMLEFLKRAHGGDEEVVIRSTRGNPSEGFTTEKIVKKSKSYHFTFAQFEADFEFWNRLLKIPVHESESKNRAVGRMVAGHKNIQIGNEDQEYGYEFTAGTKALRQHMHDVKQYAPKRAVLPNGTDGFEWDAWSVVEPIFNHSRSESNRIYSMVFNIIKASALLNYKNRERTTVTVDTDGGEKTEERDAVVVAPEDVGNVMRCLRALRATTHEIDHKKRAIVEAIRAKSGPDNAIEGTAPIREFLKESDAPEVKASELENILGDLEDNFLVEIQEMAGEGGKNVYRAFEWEQLGRPRVEANAELFADAVDPIENESFVDAYDEQRAQIQATADDLLGEASMNGGGSSGFGSGGSVDTTDDGDVSLGTWDENADDSVDLEPWTEMLHKRVAPVLNDTRIEKMEDVPVESFLGLVSVRDPDLNGVSTDGTMLDPTHDAWSQPTKPDEWVESETDARKEIKKSLDELIQAGVITFKEVHETNERDVPIDATLSVTPPS